MELKEFIAQALADVVQGVSDAQAALGKNCRYINPELSTGQGVLEQHSKHVSVQGQLVQTVDFDIAVTATEGSSSSANAGITVLAGFLNLGVKGASANEQSAVSRIKFSVPVALPYGATLSQLRGDELDN